MSKELLSKIGILKQQIDRLYDQKRELLNSYYGSTIELAEVDTIAAISRWRNQNPGMSLSTAREAIEVGLNGLWWWLKMPSADLSRGEVWTEVTQEQYNAYCNLLPSYIGNTVPIEEENND